MGKLSPTPSMNKLPKLWKSLWVFCFFEISVVIYIQWVSSSYSELLVKHLQINTCSSNGLDMTEWLNRGFSGGLAVRNPPVNAGDLSDLGLIPGLGRIPWSRKGQPTPVFLHRESHGQRSLAGYSPWDCRVRHNWATKQQCFCVWIFLLQCAVHTINVF